MIQAINNLVMDWKYMLPQTIVTSMIGAFGVIRLLNKEDIPLL